MSIFVAGEPGETIEKTMTLTVAEFEKSLARIEPDLARIRVSSGRYRLELAAGGGTGADASLSASVGAGADKGAGRGAGAVELAVDVLEPMLMGGLVKLPRCKVVIAFKDTAPEQRTAFLNRFDQAFQRGGG